MDARGRAALNVVRKHALPRGDAELAEYLEEIERRAEMRCMAAEDRATQLERAHEEAFELMDSVCGYADNFMTGQRNMARNLLEGQVTPEVKEAMERTIRMVDYALKDNASSPVREYRWRRRLEVGPWLALGRELLYRAVIGSRARWLAYLAEQPFSEAEEKAAAEDRVADHPTG